MKLVNYKKSLLWSAGSECQQSEGYGWPADGAVWPLVVLVGGIAHNGLRVRPRQDGAHRGGLQPLPRPQQECRRRHRGQVLQMERAHRRGAGRQQCRLQQQLGNRERPDR